jgi:DNA-binding winged helix-turn-helix (wHTH) protein
MKYFSQFSFDPVEGRLFRGTDELPLTRKASTLLGCLIDRAGTWVSKDAIMAAVWPDTFVQPDNIKVLVREIRLALGDAPKAPLYIRSAVGRGYTFVSRISEQAEHRGSSAAGGSPAQIFVNRGPELAMLADALDAARASSRRLVIVSGEHGSGKSVLCEAFLRGAQANGPARTSYGQCFDRESDPEPYFLFLDALVRLDRRHRGIVPDLLARVAPSWLSRFPQWQASRTAGVQPLGMLEELTALLEAMSHDTPLVLVLENLQWADVHSLRALDHLGARTAPAKLLIVATCCTGEWVAGAHEKHRLMSPSEAGPRKQAFELGPLTAEHVERYVDARFGPGCLTDLAASVHESTYGNPSLVVEAFDSLVARGLVVEAPGGWQRTLPVDAIVRALPETLSESVVQQLDQLEPREREVLEAAAAVGKDFSTGMVAAALDARPGLVRELLTPLARRGQLIVPTRERGAARAAKDGYRFRHALYADVIAQRAPMMRQLRIAERVTRIRSERLVPLRRA